MKEFNVYIKRIKSSLAYLEENVDEFKKVQDNMRIIEKLEKDIKLCKAQSIENEVKVKQSINDINKLLLSKNDS